MIYVARLRAGRVLVRYGIFLLVVFGLFVISIAASHGGRIVTSSSDGSTTVRVSDGKPRVQADGGRTVTTKKVDRNGVTFTTKTVDRNGVTFTTTRVEPNGTSVTTVVRAPRGGRRTVSRDVRTPSTIPFAVVLIIVAFVAYVIVPSLGGNLDAEYRSAAIAFTRPISRYALAARYFAVDAFAVLLAAAMGAVVAFSLMGAFGATRFLTFDPASLAYVGLAAAVAVMLYGWVVFVASLVPGRGNAVVGVCWAFAIFVPGLVELPVSGLLHAIAVGLAWLDPIAYIGSIGGDAQSNIIPGSESVRAGVAFAIGVLAIAVGTRIWATREVTV